MDSSPAAPDDRDIDVAVRARDLIEAHFRRPGCRTATLAQTLGVTASLLCHRYRSAWGTTIGRDIRAHRIAEARRLIDESPDRLIKQVAASVGYVRASYRTFLNAFRSETGVSPTDYQAVAVTRQQMRAQRDRLAQKRRSA